jgi:hypothetical protein
MTDGLLDECPAHLRPLTPTCPDCDRDDMTQFPHRPFGAIHQPRDHSVACVICRRRTWSHDAVCDREVCREAADRYLELRDSTR